MTIMSLYDGRYTCYLGGGGGKGSGGGSDNGAGAAQAAAEQKQIDYDHKLQENQQRFNDDLKAQQDAQTAQQAAKDKERAQQDAALLQATNDEIKAKYRKFYGRETAVDLGSTPLITRGQ